MYAQSGSKRSAAWSGQPPPGTSGSPALKRPKVREQGVGFFPFQALWRKEMPSTKVGNERLQITDAAKAHIMGSYAMVPEILTADSKWVQIQSPPIFPLSLSACVVVLGFVTVSCRSVLGCSIFQSSPAVISRHRDGLSETTSAPSCRDTGGSSVVDGMLSFCRKCPFVMPSKSLLICPRSCLFL